MICYKQTHPDNYTAFAEFIHKKHGSTLNSTLKRIANAPNSWGSWIEACAIMLMWNVNMIIIHIAGRTHENGLVYIVTNSKDTLVSVIAPEKINGPRIHILFHKYSLPYDYSTTTGYNHFGYLRE